MRARDEQVRARALALLERGREPEAVEPPAPGVSEPPARERRTDPPDLLTTPAALRHAVTAPSWQALAGLVAVLLVIGTVFGGRVLLAQQSAAPVPVPAPAARTDRTGGPGGLPAATAANTAAATAAARAGAPASPVAPVTPATPAVPALVVVDVVGAVARPGVQRLAAGARVVDAIAAAGGTLPDADVAQVNRARALVDGEQLRIPRRGETLPAAAPVSPGQAPGGPVGPAGSAGTTGAAGAAGGATALATAPVDLNSADTQALDALPGIGPALAARIVAWRTEHGRFTTVDELGEVSGIGDATLARLRPLVRV